MNEDGQIVVKCGKKEAVADIEDVENRKAINVVSLGLEFPYIEVPPEVENAFMKAKNRKIMESVRLISAGKSLLSGKEYHKLNQSVPLEEWDCVKSYFEWMGTGGSGLQGWLTTQPEKVQKLLSLKLTEGKREHEDDIKQFEDAIITLGK